MRPRSLAAVTLVAAALWGGKALADTPCNATTADPATVEEIQDDYPSWAGRCVRLEGMELNHMLLATREAFTDPHSWDEDPKQALLIYAGKKEPQTRTPRWVEVIGRIGTCAPTQEEVDEQEAAEAAQAAAPSDDWVIVGGDFCHSNDLNYVEPVSIRRTSSEPIFRFTEDELSEQQRDYAEAPADLPRLSSRVQLARDLLEAIGSGDEKLYEELSDPDLAEETLHPTPDAGEWVKEARAQWRVEFSKLKQVRRSMQPLFAGPGQERTFMWREDRLAWQSDHADKSPQLISCWCKDADCTGRWPVMSVDADNRAVRPYFCVSSDENYDSSKDRYTNRLTAKVRDGEGFAEPQ